MGRKKWSDKKLFNKLISNKSKTAYWENIHELRSRPNSCVFKTAKGFIKSGEKEKILIGIHVLAQLGSEPRKYLKKSLALFFDTLMATQDKRVISSSLYAIGHNNDNLTQAQISTICSFRNNKSKKVRQSLVFALLTIEESNAIETLIKLSKDKVSSIRNWAIFGLGTQIDEDNPQIRKALWLRRKDLDQETKLEAIVGLARRKDKRINKVIEKEISSGEFGSLLFDAIEELENRYFLPHLKKLLKESEKENDINPTWLRQLKKLIESLNGLGNKA